MTRIGSACSGYGGLELGLIDVIGGSVAWHVEYDKHPAAVLDARFPGVPNHGDVTTTDWTQVEPVDWLTAGYPCQPFSTAGKRKGSNDERHLWPAVRDAIGVLRPGNVLLENVAGHVSLGLDTVLGDLAALGYDAGWGVVRASEAGAPHDRARVFILASDAAERGRRGSEGEQRRVGSTERLTPAIADSDPERRERYGSTWDGWPGSAIDDRPEIVWGEYEPAIRRWEAVTGRPAPDPTEPGQAGKRRLSPRFVEWLMGLGAGWVTDVAVGRGPQLRMLGNGVVPQQAALAVRTLLRLEGEVAA